MDETEKRTFSVLCFKRMSGSLVGLPMHAAFATEWNDLKKLFYSKHVMCQIIKHAPFFH